MLIQYMYVGLEALCFLVVHLSVRMYVHAYLGRGILSS